MIVLDFYLSVLYNAGPKAREDVNNLLRAKGYEIKKLFFSRKHILKTVLGIVSLTWQIPMKVKVVVQYPIGTPLATLIILCILQLKKCYIVLLVHDLESLRATGKINKIEQENCNRADSIIIHTPNMRSVLVDVGVDEKKMKIINVFDYMVFSTPTPKQLFKTLIAFAGNLDKSPFVHKLKELNLLFNLYGVYHKDLSMIESNTVHYCGKFKPDDLSNLEASWGLVWDGDSLTTCNGLMGNYQKYNAPHKLSMYLAAGIPVIVWNLSAERDFIEKHHLGISIDSLTDLSVKLQNVSENDYILMKKMLKISL